MVDTARIEENLKQIETALTNLRKHRACTYEQFELDLDKQWIVQRGFEVIIQSMLDVGAHLLASQSENDWSEYREIFLHLGKQSIIPQRFAKKISGMAGLRNLLVHEYRRLDLRRIHSHLKKDLSDIERFVMHIRAYLQKKPRHE
jgi:uncharacterized protein YutE (UPF0331/DUF86 family)